MNKVNPILSSAFAIAHTKEEIKKLEDRIFDVLEEVQKTEGPMGLKGDKGDQGERGERGPVGNDGVPGPIGEQGLQGIPGEKGDTGEKGDKGDTGDVGPQGIQGVKGDKGDKGERGEKGIKGDKGDTGLRGEKGDRGIDGTKGDVGAQGPMGVKGDKGETGAQGPRGERGEKGEQGIPGVAGRDGKDGAQGEKGEPGTPAPDYREEFEKALEQFNVRLTENQSTVDKNIQNQIDRINRSLSTLGGGGSYKILDNADVEYKQLSVVEEDSILIYDPTKKKFVVTNMSEVLQRLKVDVETQYNKLIDCESPYTYVGEAQPGTGTAEAKWRIKRIEEVGHDYNILWAEGTADFTKIWDNRLTFTYS